MPRQSITLTEPNAKWLSAQVESKEYSSNSEIVNDLIRRARKHEATEVAAIRALLLEGEESIKQYGYSTRSVDEIWQQARARYEESHT